MELNSNISDKARNDFELVRKAVELSDQKAYTDLLETYRDQIYILLVKMVGNKEEAEDLTIETFAKAFKNLPAFRPDFAFSTWLFRIATNSGIDYLRKKKLKTLSIDVTVEENDGEDKRRLDIRSNDSDPEELMMFEQKANLLREFVDKLKPRYKNLIELRYYQQLSYEEIAEQTGMPLGTVKAQLFRARDLLHNVMKGKIDSI